ncbi:acid phosphatase 1 [Selaginella moellendorffii]|uniref:acid phosphatase 1 n=1 Tax=Selaginella moellendorffii TaxID=88036 RepID=UPI000D1CB7F7|nr:acid phosphatase 1 [Selaginella moellendorffii]|eukprot:XP_024543166.1 acid phosphatase 1 [Selaginella moellendorffii]
MTVCSHAVTCSNCKVDLQEKPDWMTVNQFCGIFQRNAEAANLAKGWTVPKDCIDYIGDYMTKGLYGGDVWGATLQSTKFARALPRNSTDFDLWVQQGKAVAIKSSLDFYNELLCANWRIVLISDRSEKRREATERNLRAAGYSGWTKLILDYQFNTNELHIQQDATAVTGASGEKTISIENFPDKVDQEKFMFFKLPNPMY